VDERSAVSELLAGGDVALARKPGGSVRLDTPVACVQGADTALRVFREVRLAFVPFDRVPTAQGPALDTPRLRDRVRRVLARNQLPAGRRAPVCDERGSDASLLPRDEHQ